MYPQHRVASFTKLSEAKRWVQMSGRFSYIQTSPLPHPREAKRHTVSDLLTRYRNDVLPHKRASTVYNQVLSSAMVGNELGHYALSAITPALIVEYRDKLARTRENSTVRRYLAVLSHAFTVAVQEWEWANENPFHKVSKPKEPRGRVRFLSEDERQRLLDSLSNQPEFSSVHHSRSCLIDRSKTRRIALSPLVRCGLETRGCSRFGRPRMGRLVEHFVCPCQAKPLVDGKVEADKTAVRTVSDAG